MLKIALLIRIRVGLNWGRSQSVWPNRNRVLFKLFNFEKKLFGLCFARC